MAITIEELDEEISNVLTMYSDDITNQIKAATESSMKELVKVTKATAPVGRSKHHYRDSIKSKTVDNDYRKFSKLWYVDGSDYRLTHLLNDGHALRDGGRYEGTQFLDKAEDLVIKKYERTVEDIING